MEFLAKLTTDDNPRLHRIPFMLIWVAAFGLSWIATGITGMIVNDMVYELFGWYTNATIVSITCGLAFGSTLALIQGWILRRRYGFVPRFWRIATIIGMTLATTLFFMMMDQYYFDTVWQAGSTWVISFALFQAIVLFRVNRQALWLLGVAILTAIIVASTELALSNPLDYDDVAIIWAILVGSAIQAIGTGIVILRVMANPREGIVPKRDSDLKAKDRVRQGMHPVTFIGFWSASILTAWGVYFVTMIFWFLTIGNTSIGYEIMDWFSYNVPWSFGVILGCIIGLVISTAQPWLMKQHSKTQVRHWLILSTLGYMIGGIGLFQYIDGSGGSDYLLLVAWFGVPALFQTIPMWRAMRGGWLWAFTGIASAIVAILIRTQFEWTYNEGIYTIIFGSIASAIISGAVFVMLQAQQRSSETPAHNL